jgi:hypothetical protein
VKGTVTEWFWSNPHCFLRFDAPGADGQVVVYTRPWVALDTLSLRLQSPNLDIQEMECSPSDQKHYYEIFGGLTGLTDAPK